MKLAALVVFTTLLSVCSAAHGQIMWGTPTTLTGDSDVSTNGTYIDALQGLPSGNNGINKPAETVNTVLFNSDNQSLTDGIITFSGPLGGGTDGGGPGSAAYQSVLAGCIYVDDNPNDYNAGTLPSPEPTGVISLAVTQGQTYQVQLWDTYANNGYRATTFSSGGTSVTLAEGDQYVIGTFTAASSTETIDFNGAFTTDQSSGIGELNAISLRETPEPSAYAMMLGGLALLGFCVRRKLA